MPPGGRPTPRPPRPRPRPRPGGRPRLRGGSSSSDSDSDFSSPRSTAASSSMPSGASPVMSAVPSGDTSAARPRPRPRPRPRRPRAAGVRPRPGGRPTRPRPRPRPRPPRLLGVALAVRTSAPRSCCAGVPAASPRPAARPAAGPDRASRPRAPPVLSAEAGASPRWWVTWGWGSSQGNRRERHSQRERRTRQWRALRRGVRRGAVASLVATRPARLWGPREQGAPRWHARGRVLPPAPPRLFTRLAHQHDVVASLLLGGAVGDEERHLAGWVQHNKVVAVQTQLQARQRLVGRQEALAVGVAGRLGGEGGHRVDGALCEQEPLVVVHAHVEAQRHGEAGSTGAGGGGGDGCDGV
jgi:hypothetical protein